MGKFNDALDRKAEEIARPPNPPVGDYIFQITKVPENKQLNDDYSAVKHICTIVSATDSVDPDELAEFGEPAGQVVSKDFIFNETDDGAINFERTMNDLKEFYERCGVDVGTGTVKEWMANSLNMQFMGELRHRPDKQDPDVVYTEIGRTAPAE